MPEKLLIRVRRRDAPGASSRLEEFEVLWREGLTVLGALEQIRRRPRDRSGAPVAPIAFESGCREERCGACTVLVNGRVRPACTAVVADLERPILVEPLAKFRVVRDLVVDRSRHLDGFARVRAWGETPVGGGFELLRTAAEREEERLRFARCTACGACDEACPNVRSEPAPRGSARPPGFTEPLERESFMGPAAIGQVALMNLREGPGRDARLERVTAHGGIQCCGNAQVCVEVCPAEIPLTEAIAGVNRQATGFAIRAFFGRVEGAT